MPRPRMSAELEQKIIAMHKVENKTYVEVSALLGVSQTAISKVLRRNGFEGRGYGGRSGARKYHLSDEETCQVVRLYEEGSSCEQISEAYGVPWHVINVRLKELGVQLRPKGFQQGEAHHDWKGGRVPTSSGYVLVLQRPGDPFYSMANIKTGNSRYALEHRIVMAEKLGRLLTRFETVHHIDGDKTNNDPSNLQLRQGGHGKGAAFCCQDCGSYNVAPAPLH